MDEDQPDVMAKRVSELAANRLYVVLERWFEMHPEVAAQYAGADDPAPLWPCQECGRTEGVRTVLYRTLMGPPGSTLLCAHCRDAFAFAMPDEMRLAYEDLLRQGARLAQRMISKRQGQASQD